MSPWIGIAVSLVSTVVMALVGFIVKRELGRVATDLTAVLKAIDLEVKERRDALDKIAADLKEFIATCENKYLSKEMFHGLETARKDLDKLRHEQDTRLEDLISQLLKKHGG